MVEANNQLIAAALAGGTLIGISAVLMMALLGRIAGISGVIGQLLNTDKSTKNKLMTSWQLYFICGLALGGWLYSEIHGVRFAIRENFSTTTLIMSGLLVGFGTRIGNGCTSGHGVCGIARLSKRSLVATCLFMSSAIATVFLTKL
ncbi:YeeE/YedE family protein [Thalassotalea euphylliae]|uniref:YeeE/YedE family protein n=1 Tax=Thalassotalea euphylliae TaxID=1655234 RepID=A0A3E0TS65_9GAMM|nr:YeeE/YedE family protein [Thalassotalea euphylliae]REL27210.1 YeeE/YedE family protein [Thalassotalea euphylliae]